MKRPMTWKEFLAGLSATEWEFDGMKRIVRVGDSSCCPWLFYARQDKYAPIPPRDSDCEIIFDAADNAPGHKRCVRKALLKACGLKEAR